MIFNHFSIPALALGLLFVGPRGLVAQTGEKAVTHGRYLVEAKHTPEECLKTLDDVSARQSSLLSKFDWGCQAGDHTGYAILEGENEAAVKAMLPASMHNARIVRLNKFTPDQIKSFHEKKTK